MKRAMQFGGCLCLLLGAATADAEIAQFRETFDAAADPSAPAIAGWSVVWDSNNPASAATNFFQDDAMCVIKLTAASDGIGGFTDHYAYIEHDIHEPGGETTVSGNLYGQDAGDVLLTTEKPARLNYAPTINVNGARFRVRHDSGQGSGGASFMFVIVLTNNQRYALTDWIASPAGGPHTVTTDPIESAISEWRLILNAGAAPGQRLRLVDTPVMLSSNQLAAIKAVGVYTAPAITPSRFDDFELLDFQVVPDYSAFRIVDFARVPDGVRISWAAQGGRRYQAELDASGSFPASAFTNMGTLMLAEGFTGTVLTITNELSADFGIVRIRLSNE